MVNFVNMATQTCFHFHSSGELSENYMDDPNLKHSLTT